MEPSQQRPPGVAGRCVGCGAPLGHDQRYCTACGTRRGPLPTGVWAALARLAGRADGTGERPPHDADEADVAGAADTDGAGPGRRDLVGLACAAAASVLLMLGAGSVMGAATSPGGVETLADTVVVALSPAHHTATEEIASAPAGHTGAGTTGGGGGGGGGGAQASRPPRTVTVSESQSPSPGSSTSSTTSSTPTPTASLPPIHHVWEIVLSSQGEQQSFATVAGHPYLSRTLVDQGTLLGDFDAVATSPLANEVALISGQGPTEQTLGDCAQYSDIVPGHIAKHGQALGSGCLYPSAVPTLGSELQIQGDTWRAFIQGIGEPGQRSAPSSSTTSTSTSTSTSSSTSTTTTSSTSGAGSSTVGDTLSAAGCPHPALGATDAGQVTADDDYVTWKNPWVYFRSELGTTTCAADDVGLGALDASLAHESRTPSLSYIAPDPCDDGSDTPCRPGARAGLAPADAFLRRVVPRIERSAAYRAGGLILITFDEAPQSGPNWSTASCCDQPAYPNLRGPAVTTSTTSTASTTTTTTTTTCTSTSTSSTPTTSTTTSTTSTQSPCAPTITGDPPGGGQVGLLMISPYVRPDTIDELHEYNDFSLLKTVSELFGVTPLGYGDDTGVQAISPSLFLSTKR